MKKRLTAIVLTCIMFAGCASNDVPELLAPIGELEDTAIVTRGELRNIETYESAVTADYENVKLPTDIIVGNVNVKLGDKVKAGQVLIEFNTEATGEQVETVDDQIQKVQRENDYMNGIAELDIEIAKLQLQISRATEGTREAQAKEGVLKKLESSLASQKIEQQKALAELQLDKVESDTTKENAVASFDGTICYLYNCKPGDKISAGTVVAVIARDNSKKLIGDYIEKNVLESADRVYAVINEKEYTVTNVPYDQFELANRTFWNLPLFSRFYFEDDKAIENGMYATIVVESDYVKDVLQIPSNALYSDKEGYYVYKKEEDKKERVNVKIGAQTVTAVEIKEGLEEGDEIYVRP